MLRRLQLVTVLFAWLLASGTQWDLVQVAAWGKMFTGYAKSMSFTQAAQKAFSGEMCSLCQAVSDAKKAETPSDVAYGAKAKPMILPLPEPVIFGLTQEVGHIRGTAGLSQGVGRSSPPTPPPRGVFFQA